MGTRSSVDMGTRESRYPILSTNMKYGVDLVIMILPPSPPGRKHPFAIRAFLFPTFSYAENGRAPKIAMRPRNSPWGATRGPATTRRATLAAPPATPRPPSV